MKNTPTILGAASIAVGVLLFLMSVTGMFWPATPVTDPGMLSTTVVFLLIGVFSMLLGKRQAVA